MKKDICDRYLNVVWAICLKSFKDKLKEGERYRLGIRHNPILNKKIYYVVDVTDGLGMPLQIEIESNYFEEQLNSISFIMT